MNEKNGETTLIVNDDAWERHPAKESFFFFFLSRSKKPETGR